MLHNATYYFGIEGLSGHVWPLLKALSLDHRSVCNIISF